MSAGVYYVALLILGGYAFVRLVYLFADFARQAMERSEDNDDRD